jgi:endoglycosylceramidase
LPATATTRRRPSCTRLDWAAAAGIDVVLDLHQDVHGEGFGFDGAPRWTCDEQRYADFVLVEPWPLNDLDPNVKACFDEQWTDPAKGEAHAAVWRHLATRFGDHPAVVGFDPINEPHWGNHDLFTFERDLLQPFYDRDVAAVRAIAPHWIAFLEPGANRNLGFPTSSTTRPPAPSRSAIARTRASPRPPS